MNGRLLSHPLGIGTLTFSSRSVLVSRYASVHTSAHTHTCSPLVLTLSAVGGGMEAIIVVVGVVVVVVVVSTVVVLTMSKIMRGTTYSMKRTSDLGLIVHVCKHAVMTLKMKCNQGQCEDDK